MIDHPNQELLRRYRDAVVAYAAAGQELREVMLLMSGDAEQARRCAALTARWDQVLAELSESSGRE